jgi:hypothetical protein
MSYNIDHFKVKRLEKLSFPVSALFENPRTDWHPVRTELPGGVTLFTNLDTELRGVIIGETFHVLHISCYGEGSGTIMEEMIEPALNQSTGILIVSCIWEGGDTINQLRSIDGDVAWIDLEI